MLASVPSAAPRHPVKATTRVQAVEPRRLGRFPRRSRPLVPRRARDLPLRPQHRSVRRTPSRPLALSPSRRSENALSLRRVTTERRTRQRDAVRAALEATHAPMRAQDIHAHAARKAPGIGLATVYRSLKALIEAGDVAVVTLPGDTPRYELAHLHHHHHFHCRACGGVFEVEGCPGDLAALAPSGFAVDGHEVVLYGRCARCAS
ncbi:MAG TPA: transcriptional repressor [Gemmatimonadaceae bacterium]|nr:transcriptional repressor [Gemmatimonadaceae bacterium]